MKKPYHVITGDKIYLLCMEGFIPGESEEVNIVLATFDEKQLPLDAKEMAHTVCDLLNSQACAIQILSDQIYALNMKYIELLRRVVPFGGPDGGG